MANDSGSGRAIGIRDWFADSRRRIQRYVPRTIASLRPTRLTSGLTLGVLMQQRGARSIEQVSPRGLAGPQQAPLVLRRVIALTAPREPILTVQSPVHLSLAPSVPPSAAADPRQETVGPALESSAPQPVREEAAPPSLLSRTLRRLFSQPEPAAAAVDRSPTDASAADQLPELSPEGEAGASLNPVLQTSDLTQESDLSYLDSSFEDADLESDMEPAEEEAPAPVSTASDASQPSFTLVRQMLRHPEGESEDGDASTGDPNAALSAPSTAASINRQEAPASDEPPAERAEPSLPAPAAPEASGLLLTVRRLFHHDEPPVTETAVDVAPLLSSDPLPQPEPGSLIADSSNGTIEPERPALAVAVSRAQVLPALELPADEPTAASGAAVSQPPPEPAGPLTLLRRLLPHHSSESEPVQASMESRLDREEMPSRESPPPAYMRVPQADAPGVEVEAPVVTSGAAPPTPSRSDQSLVFRSLHAEAPPSAQATQSGQPARASQATAEINLARWSPVYRAVPGRPTATDQQPPEAASFAYDGWPPSSSNGRPFAADSSSPAMTPFSQAAPQAPVSVARQDVPEPDQMPAAPVVAAAQPGLSGAALERLAFQVYERLRRRLITERERAGIGAQWR